MQLSHDPWHVLISRRSNNTYWRILKTSHGHVGPTEAPHCLNTVSGVRVMEVEFFYTFKIFEVFHHIYPEKLTPVA